MQRIDTIVACRETIAASPAVRRAGIRTVQVCRSVLDQPELRAIGRRHTAMPRVDRPRRSTA